MPDMPPLFGQRPRREANRQADRDRGSAHARGYDSHWSEASLLHRKRNPFCRYCELGVFGPVRVAEATLTDHLYPHRGDQVLFWRREWWVSACTDCHNGPKQALERLGRAALDALARRLGLPTLRG